MDERLRSPMLALVYNPNHYLGRAASWHHSQSQWYSCLSTTDTVTESTTNVSHCRHKKIEEWFWQHDSAVRARCYWMKSKRERKRVAVKARRKREAQVPPLLLRLHILRSQWPEHIWRAPIREGEVRYRTKIDCTRWAWLEQFRE